MLTKYELKMPRAVYSGEGALGKIPEIFAAMNKHLGSGKLSEAVADYQKAVEGAGQASACIDCKQCERACPQHLEITAYLKQCAQALEQ